MIGGGKRNLGLLPAGLVLPHHEVPKVPFHCPAPGLRLSKQFDRFNLQATIAGSGRPHARLILTASGGYLPWLWGKFPTAAAFFRYGSNR
jgi:hypothetical protein